MSYSHLFLGTSGEGRIRVVSSYLRECLPWHFVKLSVEVIRESETHQLLLVSYKLVTISRSALLSMNCCLHICQHICGNSRSERKYLLTMETHSRLILLCTPLRVCSSLGQLGVVP